jgi:hypothetical protein
MSVRPRTRMEQLCFHWMDFREIWYLSISPKSVEKIQVSLKPDKNDGALHMKTFVHLWFCIVFEWEMFQTKVVEKIKTHILCWVSSVFFENHAVYEIKVEEYGTARQATCDNIIRRMRIACCIPNVTTTQTEYVILIAFRLQQRLGERASVLLLYVHCLSC